MKTVSMKEARDQLADLIDQSQEEPVFLTRHGKPVAMLVGCQGHVDMGSFIIDGRAEFWDMIEKVRKDTRPRVSSAEVRKRFGLPPAKTAPAKKAG